MNDVVGKHSQKKSLKWDFNKHNSLLKFKKVATVCEESLCPNRHECSQAGIATFMIAGKTCTRACRFCHIDTGKADDLSQLIVAEKNEILSNVAELALKYVVITSVARDDNELLLAKHFASITTELNKQKIEVELLIPDFHAEADYLTIIGNSSPLVIAQNIETVSRLNHEIRPQASYQTTFSVFQYFNKRFPEIILKTGFMVGFGESLAEIEELLDDLKQNHIKIITIGQYLQPSKDQTRVVKHYSSKEFTAIEEMVKKAGFLGYEVGPYVRSSYMAGRTIENIKQAAIQGFAHLR